MQNYISQKRRQRNFEEMLKRHGKLDKLIDDSKKVFGYVARAEIDSSDVDNVVNVAIVVSFNFLYNMGFSNSTNSYHMKNYTQSDLKQFALERVLSLKISDNEKFHNDNVCYTLQWSGENDDLVYNNGLNAIINSYFQDLNRALNDADANFYKSEYEKYAPNIENYDKIAEYIFKCVNNVLKYYKNKKINIFFK